MTRRVPDAPFGLGSDVPLAASILYADTPTFSASSFTHGIG